MIDFNQISNQILWEVPENYRSSAKEYLARLLKTIEENDASLYSSAGQERIQTYGDNLAGIMKDVKSSSCAVIGLLNNALQRIPAAEISPEYVLAYRSGLSRIAKSIGTSSGTFNVLNSILQEIRKIQISPELINGFAAISEKIGTSSPAGFELLKAIFQRISPEEITPEYVQSYEKSLAGIAAVTRKSASKAFEILTSIVERSPKELTISPDYIASYTDSFAAIYKSSGVLAEGWDFDVLNTILKRIPINQVSPEYIKSYEDSFAEIARVAGSESTAAFLGLEIFFSTYSYIPPSPELCRRLGVNYTYFSSLYSEDLTDLAEKFFSVGKSVPEDLDHLIRLFKDLNGLDYKYTPYFLQFLLERKLPEDILNEFMNNLPLIQREVAGDCSDIFATLNFILQRLPNDEILNATYAFKAMISTPPSHYTGHTIGFEVEFFAGNEDQRAEKREVRLGPFTDITSAREALRRATDFTCLDTDAPMSTLHLVWGATEKQKNNYQNNQKLFEDILNKLTYIANPAARILHRGYNANQLENARNFKPFPGQVSPLQCRNFALALDADLEMILQTVEVIWQGLDNPDRLKELDSSLDSYFTRADIHPPKSCLIIEEEIAAWEADFGLLCPIVDGYGTIHEWVAHGRVVNHRPVVRDLLADFIDEGKYLRSFEGAAYPWFKGERISFTP